MYLTSVTNLKLNEDQLKVIDSMSSRAKALYNSSLYQINTHFKETNKYLDYDETDKLMKSLIDDKGLIVYRSLPAVLSQPIRKLHKNFGSFFALLKMKKDNTYDKSINTPKYLKRNSRKELIYTKSLSCTTFIFKDGYIYITVSKDLHKGRLKLCKVPKYIQHIDFNDIRILEIIPSKGSYELHIKYNVQIKEPDINQELKSFFSIDLGMNNLCTVTSNVTKSFILNGRGIKSINQKYNKKISYYKSKLKKGIYSSKTLDILWNKRGSKLNSEIHKITDVLVKAVLEHKIDHVVIGYNKEWKQRISLGTRTNQNFVMIPFNKILQQLEYKLRLVGIEVFLQEESYTSKCSYIDNEEIKYHTTYKGKRTNRGLFKTHKGIYINADINGSLNIYRKFLKNISEKEVYDVLSAPVDTGLVMNPIKINLSTFTSLEDINTFIQSL
jgi:putative transposase